jgi:hypothetical protein
VQHPVALDDYVGIFEQVLVVDVAEVALARCTASTDRISRAKR